MARSVTDERVLLDEGAATRDRLRRAAPALLLLLVLAIATALRAWKLAEWSLWEDEETTLYFSQHPTKGFPAGFPAFFWLLSGLYRVTGVSVGAGRAVSAGIGVLGVWLVYFTMRRLSARPAALVAAALMAINLGHVFWSQSIRYYGAALALQLISAYWFFEGFEKGGYRSLLLSNLALLAALLTHFSALLLAPVFVGYLAVVGIWLRPKEGAYRWQGYLVFGLTLAAILLLFARRLMGHRAMVGTMLVPSARDPIHVLITVVAYYGLPVIALAAIGALAARQAPLRLRLFLAALSAIPVMELCVIAPLNVINVTWYYGFIALGGLVMLAGLGLVALYEQWSRGTAWALGAVTVAYYGAFLFGYYTTMHGDRPRWAEAAAYLRETARIDATSQDNPAIFATVPGVVAFYLGVNPAETMGHPLVQPLPEQPPPEGDARQRWYVVEAKVVPPVYRAWFEAQCELKAQFKARTGPQDRSVLVYSCSSRGAAGGSRPTRSAGTLHRQAQLGH